MDPTTTWVLIFYCMCALTLYRHLWVGFVLCAHTLRRWLR